MKERIRIILDYTGMTATRLADEIGVQRSGISHIISGRNQPSFDFLIKFLTRFPEISADWILTGKGEMLKEEKPVPVNIPTTPITNDEVKEIRPVTNVTLIKKIIVLNSDGTFVEYRSAGKE